MDCCTVHPRAAGRLAKRESKVPGTRAVLAGGSVGYSGLDPSSVGFAELVSRGEISPAVISCSFGRTTNVIAK